MTLNTISYDGGGHPLDDFEAALHTLALGPASKRGRRQRTAHRPDFGVLH